ncbi:MAG: glycosyltransferase [Parcubacteria group bacterium]
MRASTLLTLGYAHGWSEACGPVKLIWQKNIIKEISKHNNPIIFTNIYNYINWGEKEIKFLKNYDSFSIVNVHPNKYEQFKKDNPLIGNGDPFFYGGHNEACNKLIETKPKFVCSFAGNTAWDLFKDWQADGLHFEFLKLAADQNYYFPDPAIKKYGHIKMTYVGGYWPEKAQAFEMYLRPFEDILHTYGYGNWPYKHYGGELDIAEERQLYSSAGLVPLVTSPAGWYMAEVTERYFKAPACKAFCIADQNTGLKDVFTEDEMLQAKNAEHFSELVNDYLKGKIDVNYWKNKAYEAVMNKHLYRHRALQIKNIFETKTELK